MRACASSWVTPVSHIAGTAQLFGVVADRDMSWVPPCHAAAAGHKAFWRHLPAWLAHQPHSIPLHPGAQRAGPDGIQLKRGHKPGHGTAQTALRPRARGTKSCAVTPPKQLVPDSTSPQTSLVPRRKSFSPHCNSLSCDPILGHTAPLTWLLIHLPDWLIERQFSWERAASAMLLPWSHIPKYKIDFTFNKAEKAHPQLLRNQVQRISNLSPCGQIPQAASAQLPSLFSSYLLFIWNVSHAAIQMQMQPELIPSVPSVPWC